MFTNQCLSNLIWWSTLLNTSLMHILLTFTFTQSHRVTRMFVFMQNSQLIWVKFNMIWGRNRSFSSVLGLLSCVMKHHAFDPPWSLWVEGMFPLDLTGVFPPYPKTLGLEYKSRPILCKDPDIHVLDGWMPTTKRHPACTIHEDRLWLPRWLDWKTVSYAKIYLNNSGEPQSNAGNSEEEEERYSFRLMNFIVAIKLVDNVTQLFSREITSLQWYKEDWNELLHSSVYELIISSLICL